MAIIGILTDKTNLSFNFFRSVIYKTSDTSLLKNPFSVRSKLKIQKKELFFVMDLTPVYPPIFYFGFLLLIPFIVFQWINIFLVLPILLIMLGFFWSSTFYLMLLLAGLRKDGYKGKVKILSKKEIIRRLF